MGTVREIKPKRRGKPPTFRGEVVGGWNPLTRRYLHRESSNHPTEPEAWAWCAATEARLSGTRQVVPKLVTDRTFADLVTRHLRDRDEDGGISAANRAARWKRSALGQRPTLSITLDDAFALLTAMRTAGSANETIRREFAYLRSVLRHGVVIRWLEFDPWAGVRLPKPGEARRRMPSDAELARLDQGAGYGWHQGTVRTREEAAMCAFNISCETGMRLGELSLARVTDIDRGNLVLHVPAANTKGRRERWVPLTEAAMRHMLRCDYGDAGELFTLASREIGDAWRRVARGVGIPKGAEPGGMTYHDSRHRAVTRMLDVLAPAEVAAAVGHKGLGQVMTYFEPDAVKIAAKLRRAETKALAAGASPRVIGTHETQPELIL